MTTTAIVEDGADDVTPGGDVVTKSGKPLPLPIQRLEWVERQPVSASAKCLLYVLVKRMLLTEGTVCWPKQETIAAAMGCHERQVRKHITTLERAGVLTHRMRKGPKGQGSNVYTLVKLPSTLDPLPDTAASEVSDLDDQMDTDDATGGGGGPKVPPRGGPKVPQNFKGGTTHSLVGAAGAAAHEKPTLQTLPPCGERRHDTDTLCWVQGRLNRILDESPRLIDEDVEAFTLWEVHTWLHNLGGRQGNVARNPRGLLVKHVEECGEEQALSWVLSIRRRIEEHMVRVAAEEAEVAAEVAAEEAEAELMRAEREADVQDEKRHDEGGGDVPEDPDRAVSAEDDEPVPEAEPVALCVECGQAAVRGSTLCRDHVDDAAAAALTGGAGA